MSLFKWKKFNLTIIDEATQILEPLTLAPLYKAEKFVLVGDPKQLPPLVMSEEARQNGADISLFEKLSQKYPACTTVLKKQYRMDTKIMDLANYFCYDGMLKNGKISQQANQIFLHDVIDTNFIEKCQKNPNAKFGMVSDAEAEKIFEILSSESILKNSESVGIISPFNKQVLKLKNKIFSDSTLVKKYQNLEINTIDRYQGRDKDVIIISFAQQVFTAGNFKNLSQNCLKTELHSTEKSEDCSENFEKFSILNDFRRLNVAITRAKSKLILVGNFSVLKKFKTCEKILNYLEEKLESSN